MSDTFSSIPIIDWRRLQDPATKQAALDDLREAIFVVGFLYLTNHGLEVLTFHGILMEKADRFRISLQKHTRSSPSCLISLQKSKRSAT